MYPSVLANEASDSKAFTHRAAYVYPEILLGFSRYHPSEHDNSAQTYVLYIAPYLYEPRKIAEL